MLKQATSDACTRKSVVSSSFRNVSGPFRTPCRTSIWVQYPWPATSHHRSACRSDTSGRRTSLPFLRPQTLRLAHSGGTPSPLRLIHPLPVHVPLHQAVRLYWTTLVAFSRPLTTHWPPRLRDNMTVRPTACKQCPLLTPLGPAAIGYVSGPGDLLRCQMATREPLSF